MLVNTTDAIDVEVLRAKKKLEPRIRIILRRIHFGKMRILLLHGIDPYGEPPSSTIIMGGRCFFVRWGTAPALDCRRYQ
jgi:hypothetical protein